MRLSKEIFPYNTPSLNVRIQLQFGNSIRLIVLLDDVHRMLVTVRQIRLARSMLENPP